MTSQNPAGPDAWDDKIRATRDAADAATAIHEQTIRDAHHLGGRRVADITRALGISNRNRVTALLNPSPDSDVPQPQPPTIPPVVYLRAPGHGEQTWAELRHAFWSRGWIVQSDRTAAWHLSRGGAKVVRVDLAAQLDDDPIIVDVVRAVYGQPQETRHVRLAEFLPTMEGIRLERELPEAADWRIAVTFDDDAEWRRLAGGTYARPTCWKPEATNNLGQKGAFGLDVQAVASIVANLLK